jgi:hypothetical protein
MSAPEGGEEGGDRLFERKRNAEENSNKSTRPTEARKTTQQKNRDRSALTIVFDSPMFDRPRGAPTKFAACAGVERRLKKRGGRLTLAPVLDGPRARAGLCARFVF